MPTAPYNPRRRDEEEDADVPSPTMADEIEVDFEPVPSAPVSVPQPLRGTGMRPTAPDAFAPGGIPDAPNLQTRRAVTKIQLGQPATQRDYRNIAQRQGIERQPTLQPGVEGMDAPDLTVRTAALKAQAGAPLSNREIDRLNTRQALEAQQGNLPAERSVSTLLAGSRLDPRGTRAEQAAEARRLAAEQKQQARAQEIQARREFNSKALAEYKAKGIRYYTDPADGRIKPVVDDKGRILHYRSDWEPGVDPQGRPAKVMRDEYGQRQFKRPTVVASPDAHDEFLYADMGDGESVPYMKIEEAVAHPDFSLQRTALAARRRRNEAMHREALAPVKALADQAQLEYDSAKEQIAQIQGQIETAMQQSAAIDEGILRETEGGFLGIGAKPTGRAQQAQSQRDAIGARMQQLQAAQMQLEDDLKPGGRLARAKVMGMVGLKLATATAVRDAYRDQEQEILARLRFQGRDAETDPMFIENRKRLQEAEAVIQGAGKERQRYEQLFNAAAPTAAAPVPPAPEEGTSTLGGIVNVAERAGRQSLAAMDVLGASNRARKRDEYLAQAEKLEQQAANVATLQPSWSAENQAAWAERARQSAAKLRERAGTMGESMGAQLAGATEQMQKASLLKAAEGYQKYSDAEKWDAVKAFLSNPVEVATNIAAEGALGSIPALVMGAAGAATGGIPGMAGGTAIGSFATEYAGSLLESFEQAGVDLADPTALAAAFDNPQIMADAQKRGTARGIPVAVFDLLSAGLAGRTVAPAVRSGVRQVLKTGAREMGEQMLAGAGGETTGQISEQLAMTGEVSDLNLGDIAAEAIGEVVPGGAQIAMGAATRRGQQQAPGGTLPPPEDTGRPSTDVPPPPAGPITAADVTPPAQPTPEEAAARLQAEAANDPELAALLAESEPAATAAPVAPVPVAEPAIEAPAGTPAPSAEVAPTAAEPAAAPVAQVPEPAPAVEPPAPVAAAESPAVAGEAKAAAEPLPKKVRIAGAEFDVVKRNPDGTITVRNAEGGEFDTAPGEQWEPVAEEAPQAPRAIDFSRTTREQFIADELGGKERQRKIALMEAENAIRKGWKPAKPLPVGINKLTAFLTKDRHTGEERKLLTRYQIAKRNLESDTRADADVAGRVYDRLKASKQPSPSPEPPVSTPTEITPEAETTQGAPALATPNFATATSEEIDAWEKTSKKQDEDIEVQAFGPERAKEYRKLQRTANGSGPNADRAYERVQQMEDALSPEQQDILFGRKLPEGWVSPEDAKSLRNQAIEIDASRSGVELARASSRVIQSVIAKRARNETVEGREAEMFMRVMRRANELNVRPQELVRLAFQYRAGIEGADVFELAGVTPEQLREFIGESEAAPAEQPAALTIEAPKATPTPAEDYARYQAIQREWAELRKRGVTPDSEEIRRLWAENEEIKNRHGGMPPEEPKAERRPSPAVLSEKEAQQQLIMGMTWDELKARQQGARAASRPLAPIDAEKMKAKIEKEAAKFRNAQNAAMVDRVGAILPDGYVLEGDTYVYRAPAAPPSQPTKPDALPEQSAAALPVRNAPESGQEVRGGNEVVQEPAGEAAPRAEGAEAVREVKPPAQMKRPELRAELRAAGVESVSGVPLDDANAAQLMAAVGKLRRGQLDTSVAGATADERAKKVARIKELNAQAKALSDKGGLTKSEAATFKRLMGEANSLRFDIAKPLTLDKIPSAAERQSTLPSEIVLIARDDLMRDKKIYTPIVDAAIGVAYGADTAVDDVMAGKNPDVTPKQFYDAFSATRKALREHYGDAITLYRATGSQKEKLTTNWATTREFAQSFGDNIVKRDVPVDEIVAVNVGPNGKYHEIIVGRAPDTATPTTDKLLQRLQETKKRKVDELRGKAFAAPEGLYRAAEIAALDIAILAVRAGRPIELAVRMAVARFKARYPNATADELAKAEASVRGALAEPPPTAPTEPESKKSLLPESLKERNAPVQSIEYEVRSQEERKREASEFVAKNGAAAAERALADEKIPGDTRVAIGGQLLNDRMLALKEAKPEDIPKITRDIQRITAAMQPKLATEAGQTIAMFNAIYGDVGVSAGLEYVREASARRLEKMGGEEAGKALDEATAILNDKELSDADKKKAIDKLRDRYTTKPVRRVLDQLQRVEVAKELNKLGALTRDDLVNVAGNALGMPGISQDKLKHIAELADKIKNAKTLAERTSAEIELSDMLTIYKGVSPMDLEASILTLNILSGYTTQLRNLGGNAMQAFANLATTALTNPTKVGALTRGLVDGLQLGGAQAKSILATGRGTRDFADKTGGSTNLLQTVDYARDFPGLNPTVGNILTKRARLAEKVGRFMKAADAVFYYPAREAYARMMATKLLEGEYKGAELAKKVSETLRIRPEDFASARKQAEAEGFTGVDLGRRISDIIEANRAETAIGAEVVKQSERFAAESTYTNEPVGLAGVIYRNLSRTVKESDVGGVPVLKPWAMFLKTPANVFNATTNWTPAGALRAARGMKGEKYRKGATGEGQWRNFTAEERSRLYLQSIIGTSIMGAMVANILKDEDQEIDISASGPTDPNKRRQLQAAGWSPYSIRIGDKRISYKDSPLLVPLAIVGHVADAVRYQKTKSDLVLESKVLDAVASAPNVIFQTSMLSGLSDLMAAMSGKGGGPEAITRTLSSIPANLTIPYNRLFQQIDQTFDNQSYEVNPLVGSVPFARRTGDPMTDVQGRARTYSPLQAFGTVEGKDKVDTLLRDKGLFISEPSKDTKIGNRVMTEDEYRKYRQLSGQRIRVRLEAIVPRLRIMTKEAADKEIKRITSEERERAKRAVIIGAPAKR